MSFFAVTRERIEKVWNHPNADRLDLAKLEGISYQFVVGRDSFKPGDEVFYFPIDSIIPEDVQQLLGVEGKLSGGAKNRVKTVRLRQEISQGLVLSVDKAPEAIRDLTDSAAITDAFGVTKYEPPEVFTQAGKLSRLPLGLSKYDIENAERYSDVLESLLDVPVVVMEKVEGSNFSVTWCPTEKRIMVNQRNWTIDPIENAEHAWWKAARKHKIIDFVEWIRSLYGEDRSITAYGELIGPGIQDNIYGYDEHRVKLFDIFIDGKFVGWNEFWILVRGFFGEDQFNDDELPDFNHRDTITVPILWRDGTLNQWFAHMGCSNIVELSHGNSLLVPFRNVLREGIVIKPVNESYSRSIGRTILKVRDPIYLSKSDS